MSSEEKTTGCEIWENNRNSTDGIDDEKNPKEISWIDPYRMKKTNKPSNYLNYILYIRSPYCKSWVSLIIR